MPRLFRLHRPYSTLCCRFAINLTVIKRNKYHASEHQHDISAEYARHFERSDGLAKTGMQLSTGKRVVNPSDDPIAAAQVIMLGQAQSENSQYTLARTFARQSMSLEESILSKVADSVIAANTQVISGGGVKSDDDRQSVAAELRGIKAQLLNMANSTDGNGNYIFAGYETDSAPYVQGTSSVDYIGGYQAIEQRVDAARSMTVSHIGSAVFNGVTGDAQKNQMEAYSPICSQR